MIDTQLRLGTVNGAEFARAVKQVAVAADKGRGSLPPLNGVYLEIEPSTITLVATDRYRLATRDIALDFGAAALSARVLVTASELVGAAKHFAKASTVSVTLDDDAPTLVFDDGEGPVALPQLDAKFPPLWRELFPQVVESTAIVNVRPLVYAVREVAKVASAHKATVRVQRHPDNVRVSVRGLPHSEFYIQTLSGTGTETESDFNPKSLRDGVAALRATSADITFYRRRDVRNGGNLFPICLSAGGYRYLLMPERATPTVSSA